MADNQKYYYMRLKEGFFDTDEMKLLESLPDGYLYSNILLKLYLLSLEKNGRLMFRDRIPYNAQMIAALTRHQIGTVERALNVLREFEFIEVLDTGAIYMLDIQSYIGQSSTEADRKREYRKQIAAEKENGLPAPVDNSGADAEQIAPVDNSGTNVQTDGGQNSDISVLEIRDKRLEIRDKRLEGDIEAPAAPAASPLPAEKSKRIDYQAVVDLYNSVCVSLPKVKSLSEDRKKAIRARVNTYGMEKLKIAFEKANASSFLSGKNARNWTANFDWIIKDSSIAKVLDGNYDDKTAQATRREAVPDWCQDEINHAQGGLKKLHEELRTAGNDESVRARAEALRKQLEV